mgnify:CR=1 FL=1
MADEIPEYDDPGPEAIDYMQERARKNLLAELRKLQVRDVPENTNERPPKGYIVHPDGYTEYFPDPKEEVQAVRDTQQSIREYRGKQREDEST